MGEKVRQLLPQLGAEVVAELRHVELYRWSSRPGCPLLSTKNVSSPIDGMTTRTVSGEPVR